MATLISSFSYVNETDAGYRAWTSRLRDLLVDTSAGLITQTADSGQMDFASVARPSPYSRPHYFILKFDDALGPPVFIRFECGTGASPTNIGLSLQIGTATDGSGNLVGPKLVSAVYNHSPGTVMPSAADRVCVVPGFIGLVFGDAYNNSNATLLNLVISRSQDAAGEFDADGVQVFYPSSALLGASQNNFAASLEFNPAIATLYNLGSTVAQPANLPSYIFQGKLQPLPCFYIVKKLRISGSVFFALKVDVALHTEVQAELAGGGVRNYRNYGLRPDAPGGSSANCLLGLWE